MDLLPAERGTRTFFGKEYHWSRDERGVLHLNPGPEPFEECASE